MNRREQALAYFVRMGWTREQSAGLVANLEAESGLRPDAVGDDGRAYGIAQWHPDRQANFAAVLGKDIRGSTFEEQLAFVHAELNNFEKAAGDRLREATTAYEAGATVSINYERPADRAGEASKRGQLAESIATAAQEGAGAIPAAPTSQPTSTPQGGSMGALIPIFGAVLAQLLPQVGVLFGGKQDAKNAAVLATVLDTVVKTATGDPNATPTVATMGAAIEAMQADKAVQQKVQQAVVTQPDVIGALQLVEVGGGAAAAAERDLAARAEERPFWQTSAVFWVSVLLLPMVYWFVGSMIVGGVTMPDTTPDWLKLLLAMFGNEWTGEARSGGFNLVIGLVLGGICGVYYGVSVTQGKQQQQQQTGTGMQP